MLGAPETAQALPYCELLAELRKAVLEHDEGRITCPARLIVPMQAGGLMLSMPAVAGDIAVHKLVTVTSSNAALGLPTIQGQVSVMDVGTGQIELTLDGPTVTGRRTAAMSMLGLGSLLGGEPKHVLIVGTGTQSRHHLEAIAALYPAARVSIRGSSQGASERFCSDHLVAHAALTPHHATNIDEDVEDIDVVITCTTSRQPVYTAAARVDRLVIAVGAFRPDAAEIGAATVLGSTVYVDELSGARHEAGDLLQAGVDWNGVLPLAQALRHGLLHSAPRLFKTVGCAAWDLAAARVALRQSRSFCLSITRDTMP